VPHQVGFADRVIARLASRSHGVVTRAALLEAGITREHIRARRLRGSLIRVHRGVYRVGHVAPSREARYMAAVRACGDAALLSGLAAAHLLGLVKGREPTPEVTAPFSRRAPGVVTHESRHVHSDDRSSWLGIPVTSAARTLVDVAAVLPTERLGRACHEAGVLHGTTPRDVDDALARRPNAKGAGALRAVLHGEARIVLSELERRFLALLEEAGLPLPRTNLAVGGRRVDARWPDPGVTVELDGYRFHSSRHAWETDRRREREAYARGDDFRRYTWDDVTKDSSRLLVELRRLLLVRRPSEQTQPGGV
jgi:hypothetical protein